jgi:hypothetical protein
MTKRFAIMHRTERWNKEVVMSTIDSILDPLSQYVEMEANMHVKEAGEHVEITIVFDIKGVK